MNGSEELGYALARERGIGAGITPFPHESTFNQRGLARRASKRWVGVGRHCHQNPMDLRGSEQIRIHAYQLPTQSPCHFRQHIMAEAGIQHLMTEVTFFLGYIIIHYYIQIEYTQ